MTSKATREVPANFGPMKGAHGHAKRTGPCGDTMEFWLTGDDELVGSVSYTTDGCGISVVCGSVAASLGSASTIQEIKALTPEKVLALLPPIPEESAHCAKLAIDTLQLALENLKERRRALGQASL